MTQPVCLDSRRPIADFIAWLRETAIVHGGANPRMIDKIDQLRGVDEENAEIEELNTKLYDLEAQAEGYKDALQRLLHACTDYADAGEDCETEWQAELAAAQAALDE